MTMHWQPVWPPCLLKKDQRTALRRAVLCFGLCALAIIVGLVLNSGTAQADETSPESCDTSVFVGEKSTYAINLHLLRSPIPNAKGIQGVDHQGELYEAESPVMLSIQGIQHYEEAGDSYFLGHMAARTFKWFDQIFNYREEIYTLVDSDLSKTRRSWEHSRLRKSPLRQDESRVNYEIDWNNPPTVMSYKNEEHRYTFPSIARGKPGPLPNSLDLVSGFFSARCRELNVGDEFSVNYIDRKRNFGVHFEVVNLEEIFVPALLEPVPAYHLIITSGHVQYGKPKIKPNYDLHAWIEAKAPHRVLYASGKASALGSATFEMVEYTRGPERNLVPPAPVWLSTSSKKD